MLVFKVTCSFHKYCVAPLCCSLLPPSYSQNLPLQLQTPGLSFNLDDPYLHQFSLKYNCLHDPHLRYYHKRKDILRMLKRRGFVTCDNKVGLDIRPIKNSPLQAGLPQPLPQPPAAARGQGLVLVSLGAEAVPTSPWQVPVLPFSGCPTLPA